MYQENISEFVSEGVLYLPKKGCIKDYVDKILPEVGMDINTGLIRKNGKEVGRLELKLRRAEDIPQFVADSINMGKTAYGLTGDDLFDEFRLSNNVDLVVLNTYDWFEKTAEYNRPALELMNKTGTFAEFGDFAKIAVCDKYPKTSVKYLENRFGQKGIKFLVTEYGGDAEESVAEGTNNGCIEIVNRGTKSTISAKSKNGLNRVEIVRFSDISLIGQNPSIKANIPTNIWEQEYQRILQRRDEPTDSNTSKLLQNKNEIIKKFGQETAEMTDAYATRKNITGEALDVFYATMLMLASTGKRWNKIEEELQKRWK